MKLLCRYYSNPVRLAAGISAFADESGFRFFCIKGAVSKNKDQFQILSSPVTVCVSYVSAKSHKNLMVVLTSDKQYRDCDGSYVELDELRMDTLYSTICALLLEKFILSHNPFCLELAREKESVVLAPEEDPITSQVSLSCIVRGAEGEVGVVGNTAITNVLTACTDIRCFEYKTVTPDVEKQVRVSKSRGEMYREIARYLGRTIVLVSIVGSNQMVEQYISATSVLEMEHWDNGNCVFKKISPVVLRSLKPFYIYLTKASVDEIAREQGKALRKK